MTVYQMYHHFHPKVQAPPSLTHEQQVALSEKAYNLYMAIREYVYVHGLHCESDRYQFQGKDKHVCQACKALRKAMDEA